MEFEPNKPATPRDIALADAPKVTLTPFHTDLHSESAQYDYSHANEAVFEFEAEKTSHALIDTPKGTSHRGVAFFAALACSGLFVVALVVGYLLR